MDTDGALRRGLNLETPNCIPSRVDYRIAMRMAAHDSRGQKIFTDYATATKKLNQPSSSPIAASSSRKHSATITGSHSGRRPSHPVFSGGRFNRVTDRKRELEVDPALRADVARILPRPQPTQPVVVVAPTPTPKTESLSLSTILLGPYTEANQRSANGSLPQVVKKRPVLTSSPEATMVPTPVSNPVAKPANSDLTRRIAKIRINQLLIGCHANIFLLETLNDAWSGKIDFTQAQAHYESKIQVGSVGFNELLNLGLKLSSQERDKILNDYLDNLAKNKH